MKFHINILFSKFIICTVTKQKVHFGECFINDESIFQRNRYNMSVDSYNNEDIRNLIYRAPPPDEKFPMYHSKFSKKVREDTKKVKSCHKTFGYAEVPLDPPSNFLKKKTRMVRRPFVGMHSLICTGLSKST